MSILKLELSNHTKKFIKKNKSSNPNLIKKLGLIINELKNNPLPNSCKKLVGYPFYRIRVGNYRIVYRYNKEILYITLIEKRDKVYDFLNKV